MSLDYDLRATKTDTQRSKQASKPPMGERSGSSLQKAKPELGFAQLTRAMSVPSSTSKLRFKASELEPGSAQIQHRRCFLFPFYSLEARFQIV